MNTYLKYYIFALFLFCGYLSIAQKKQHGSIQIKGETTFLDSLIEKNKTVNNANKVIKGYRIQLFSGTERNNANAVKTKFLKLFPDQTAYLIYNQPYFKIRVGDFRTKIDAEIFYNKIKAEFGECIIISDNISLPKL
ncbi:MAG: SPOR domain-containing protein [Bacteroidota bacterium]